MASLSFGLLYFPSICRVFISTLQHCILDAFRKFLVASPLSLDTFREEGIWELIFSENFFYFGSASEDASVESCMHYESQTKCEGFASNIIEKQTKVYGVEILQIEVISFVEFAATSNGSAHNLVLFPFSLCLMACLVDNRFSSTCVFFYEQLRP